MLRRIRPFAWAILSLPMTVVALVTTLWPAGRLVSTAPIVGLWAVTLVQSRTVRWLRNRAAYWESQARTSWVMHRSHARHIIQTYPDSGPYAQVVEETLSERLRR